MMPSGLLAAKHTRAAAVLIAAGLVVVGSPGVGVANAWKYPGFGGRPQMYQEAPYADAVGGAAMPEVWPDPVLAGYGPDLLLSGYANNLVGVVAGPSRGAQKTWSGGGSGAQLATSTYSTGMPGGPSGPIVMPGEGPTPGATASVVGGDMPAPQDGQSTSPAEPTNPIVPVPSP